MKKSIMNDFTMVFSICAIVYVFSAIFALIMNEMVFLGRMNCVFCIISLICFVGDIVVRATENQKANGGV